MTVPIIIVFAITYLAIAFEHPIKVSKSAPALIGAGLLWTIHACASTDLHLLAEELSKTLISTAQIVFFLMGAMTIVEVVNVHRGFDIITSKIRIKNLAAMLWVICWISFFMSAILDNLTTVIIMFSLARKLLYEREDKLLFAGMIVIAANAGGAWSPVGDVTTTMLWVGGQITPQAIIKSLIIPSTVNLAIPLVITSWMLRGRIIILPEETEISGGAMTTEIERRIMFSLGLGVLAAVPFFKAVTHLPPFIGVLFGLGLLWLVGDVLHKNKPFETRNHLNLSVALSNIDLSSLTFFIGILLAVATLEHTHILSHLAGWLDEAVGRQALIVMLIGIFSAVIDNVPLVAATIGMYSLEQHPTDSFIWEFLAYCAGTGGSILVIGSAAGVAAMGIEKIDFVWYLKKISWLAFTGYIAGALVYISSLSL